ENFRLGWIYSVAATKRYKRDVVTLLRAGCPIPRAMECDEGPVLVVRRKLGACIERQAIGGPVRAEECGGCLFGRAVAGFLAVAAVLGSQHELLQTSVVIA